MPLPSCKASLSDCRLCRRRGIFCKTRGKSHPKAPRKSSNPRAVLASKPWHLVPYLAPRDTCPKQEDSCSPHAAVCTAPFWLHPPTLQPSHTLEHPQAGMAHTAVLSKAPCSRGGITPGMTLWLPASTCKRHSNLVKIFLMVLSSSLLSKLFCFPLHPHLKSQSNTYVKRQHLHGRVEEFVFWVLDVPAAEEEPVTETKPTERDTERGGTRWLSPHLNHQTAQPNRHLPKEPTAQFGRRLSVPDQLNHGLLPSAGKQRALAKVAPLRKGQIIFPLEEHCSLLLGSQAGESKKFDLNCQKSQSQVSLHALGCPHTPLTPRALAFQFGVV